MTHSSHMDAKSSSMRKDLTGKRYGRLVVLRLLDEKEPGRGECLWECRCDCGNICKANTTKLRSGRKRSCGCLQVDSRFRDVTGVRFGSLTALEYTGRVDHGSAVWKFRCDCGRVVDFRLARVQESSSRSCGCLELELRRCQAITMHNRLIRENGTIVNILQSNVMYRHNTSGYRGVTWHSHEEALSSRVFLHAGRSVRRVQGREGPAPR